MKKNCDECGNSEFTVELIEYDSHARTSQSTNMVTEVEKLICIDCGEEYHV